MCLWTQTSICPHRDIASAKSVTLARDGERTDGPYPRTASSHLGSQLRSTVLDQKEEAHDDAFRSRHGRGEGHRERESVLRVARIARGPGVAPCERCVVTREEPADRP